MGSGHKVDWSSEQKGRAAIPGHSAFLSATVNPEGEDFHGISTTKGLFTKGTLCELVTKEQEFSANRSMDCDTRKSCPSVDWLRARTKKDTQRGAAELTDV